MADCDLHWKDVSRCPFPLPKLPAPGLRKYFKEREKGCLCRLLLGNVGHVMKTTPKGNWLC